MVVHFFTTSKSCPKYQRNISGFICRQNIFLSNDSSWNYIKKCHYHLLESLMLSTATYDKTDAEIIWNDTSELITNCTIALSLLEIKKNSVQRMNIYVNQWKVSNFVLFILISFNLRTFVHLVKRWILSLRIFSSFSQYVWVKCKNVLKYILLASETVIQSMHNLCHEFSEKFPWQLYMQGPPLFLIMKCFRIFKNLLYF